MFDNKQPSRCTFFLNRSIRSFPLRSLFFFTCVHFSFLDNVQVPFDITLNFIRLRVTIVSLASPVAKATSELIPDYYDEIKSGFKLHILYNNEKSAQWKKLCPKELISSTCVLRKMEVALAIILMKRRTLWNIIILISSLCVLFSNGFDSLQVINFLNYS